MSAHAVDPSGNIRLGERDILSYLCELSLNPSPCPAALQRISQMDAPSRDEFVRLANSHHVVIRGLEPVVNWGTLHNDSELVAWATAAIVREKARVANALLYLHAICAEMEAANCPVTVMKSLDHYPDIGSDLDLYTTATEEQIQDVMRKKFNATAEPRSWGDRIAQKHNFKVPGLPESVEIHVQRLGQMGEHTFLARRFFSRRVQKTVQGRSFWVPAAEERIIVATLQRMYRHFYFRVCDFVNSTAIVESDELDMAELKRATERVGIWAGTASYLQIVSDFGHRYRGRGLRLPAFVSSAAQVNGEKISVRKDFFRVPILPDGASLYSQQVTKTAMNGNVPATFRLSLLPYLASAAAISYKLTGSDKGIW